MTPELARHTEKLLYFYEIINERSLQATSRKHGISAASLSYSLKELESAAGMQLLVRSKKGIAPTTAGEKLYEFCRKLFISIENLHDELSGISSQRSKIKIGTFSSIAIYFWPLLQKEIKNSLPGFSITTKRSKEILELLVRKDIDIAITVGRYKHSHIVNRELYRDKYAFYEIPEKMKSKQFFDKPLFYFPDAEDDAGVSLKTHLRRSQMRFQDEFELDSFEVIIDFIRKGFGAGILPVRVAQNSGYHLQNVTSKVMGVRSFGEHCFYLSHRDDLEMKQSDLDVIIKAASKAVLSFK